MKWIEIAVADLMYLTLDLELEDWIEASQLGIEDEIIESVLNLQQEEYGNGIYDLYVAEMANEE